MEIRISVRSLVEFILRSGDIDNRKVAAPEGAMQEGGRIHRMIQRRMGPEYQAEVGLRYVYDAGEYTIVVEGRADGIITDDNGITVDEIKGTYRDLKKVREPVSVHLAQAKCYAAICAEQRNLSHVRVRMTYCHMETEELKYFHYDFTKGEIGEWFAGLIGQYRRWADFSFTWQKLRQDSIKALEFPFDYRKGQKELATYVYRTIYHKRKLFIEAPTGVGKTLSTVFPAVKAMGEGLCERIFYLTAKTITRTVADNTFELLREKGLRFKSVILTAKEKICFLEEMECNPEHCPYAKGHYDRINDAIYDLLIKEDRYSREKIEEYARKHEVCPFEMCLDMSLFSDGIICDYNYVFDPHVYLRRFFAEGVQGEYLFLVDEAHNLVERGRDMYSAVLRKEDFLELKRIVKAYDEKITYHLDKCNKELLALKRECDGCRVEESVDAFVRALTRLGTAMDEYLEEHEDSPIRKDILEFYFEVSHFLEMYELMDENYVAYSEIASDAGFILKLFCVNPGRNLRECMMRGRSTILFSATLLPIQYYKDLLGAEEGDYEVYAQSVFNPQKMGLYIGCDVTSRYTRRSREEFQRIASYIDQIVSRRQGNYLLFFPSHAFLRQVYEIYQDCFNQGQENECILQEEYMNEQAREDFLSRFMGNEDCALEEMIHMEIEVEEEKSLLGFCVMGGIFSEGIDLKNDSLIGAVIVGTGLPQVCNEREILKNYFDERGQDGFDYAYRYPGMNKVMQAAGRVIRTEEDFGVVALLDDRFLSPAYQRLFPREWSGQMRVTVDRIGHNVERFWDEWL